MDINELTPRQKTAIILTSLPPEISNSILMSFSPEERRAINAEFPKVRNIPDNIKQQVLNEFLQKNRQTISFPKQETPAQEEQKKEEPISISQNLDKLLGKQPIQQNPTLSTTKLSKPLDFLAAVNPKKVYWVLKNESNSTIAFILSQLSPAVSQRILSVFPTSQQTEISKYMIGIRKPDNRVIEVVAKFIRQELEEIDIPPVGESSFSQIQQTTTSPTEQQAKQTVATASIVISNKKIDFADISLLKQQDMEHLLKLTNKNDWVNALKGVSPEIADKILSLMPQVQAKVIKKDLETATVSKEDIIKAQRDILFKVKGLVTIGKVKIV
ncbi:MAG: FliG C-terminal domain-containing protein [Candidatus Calescibacterium sp.]|nr:hypothetical protein [Candidatus Calescibacterium sp.]MCX7972637.1 hypothetical protein [bacterium]MDW8194766.1 FliG C-terminal domain-containing protein [Candidatus Calescibacterium sp.]